MVACCFNWIRLLCRCGILVLLLAMPAPLQAQTAAPATEKIDRLLELLSDPEIKTWLADQNKKNSLATPPASNDVPTLSDILRSIRGHIQSTLAAVPRLPAQFERMWIILNLEFQGRLAGVLTLVLVFITGGFGLEWLARRSLKRYRDTMLSELRSTPHGRVKGLGLRLLFAAIMIGSFVVGSAGVFIIFDWPPLLREIVLGYLTAAIVTRGVMMVTRALLIPPQLQLPEAEKFRVLPMTDERAGHWYVWLAINVGWFMFASITLSLLGTFGFDQQSRLALGAVAGLVQLLLLLAAAWLRPIRGAGEAESRISHKALSWLLTIILLVLWLFRGSGLWAAFWLAAALVVLPTVIVAAHRGAHFILRGPDPGLEGKPAAPVLVTMVDRGIRMLLIAGAALFLLWVWSVDLNSMQGDTLPVRLLRGSVNAAVIILVADFGWSVAKALISRRLEGVTISNDVGHAPQGHHARLRTLLPIFQNILFAAVMVVTIMMVLSSLGIQIGPLIAGAGVVGVAIGFGSQTLVKDIISGMFYLLDDAFRVGEYIESGNYRGTVESFSLRSVKLRHHRGYLFTVPFGQLGAIQNMSRDWVIDKFSVTVGYDTDIDKARKLIKKIGLDLAADPEFAPHVIEPLKMQGVQKFGDYGIEIRMKMKTTPGEQFTMRRKAFVIIKRTFEENGISIPFPTVHVQEGKSAAAAMQSVMAAKPTETPI
jgi:moderate conductance mechanosensitive channel